MTEVEVKKAQESLQDRLAQVVELLQRGRLVEYLSRHPEATDQGPVDDDARRQDLTELQHKLDELHPADIAYILEALPLDERLTAWQRVRPDRDGATLLEVSDAVRETLIADMEDHELLAAAREMDVDELADLAPELPRDVVLELMESLDAQQRERMRSVLSYEEDQVGALMDFEMVTIREDVGLAGVLRALRRQKAMPGLTAQLVVLAHEGRVTGVLAATRMVVNDLSRRLEVAEAEDPVTFNPD